MTLLAAKHKTRAATIATACTFLLSFAVFVARAELRIGLAAPPVSGDEPDYDLLARELAAGHGFRFDYDRPDWRATVAKRATANSEEAWRLDQHGAAVTTYRPPLFPLLIAGVYRISGHNFAVVRLLNCAALAAAGAVAAWIVALRLGLLPGLLCGGLFAVLDDRTRFHGGQFTTESLAALLTALIWLTLCRFRATGTLRTAALAGLLTGLAILNRTFCALWLPVLVPLVYWITPAVSGRRTWRPVALLSLSVAVVLAPWAVRNSRLTGRFTPLGLHGEINLTAGYSDEAFHRRGLWYNLNETAFFNRPPAAAVSPGIAQELADAEQSKAAAFRWMRAHPLKLPLLALMKVWTEWKPGLPWDSLILGLAALGLAVWPNRTERQLMCGLLAANTLAVAVTWSVGGRFLVPILPVLHAAAAAGLWAVLRTARYGPTDGAGGDAKMGPPT